MLWTKNFSADDPRPSQLFFGLAGLLAGATSPVIWQKTTGLRSATGMLHHSSSSGLEDPLQLWMLTAVMRLFSRSGNRNTGDLELHLCCSGIIMLTGHLANHLKVMSTKSLISRTRRLQAFFCLLWMLQRLTMFTLSPTHAQYGPSSNPLQTASMSGISRMSIPDTATDCVHHSTSNVWPPLFCCSGLTLLQHFMLLL